MPATEDDLPQRLRELFRAEAQEQVRTIASGLIELERTPAGAGSGVLDAVFRAAHSLKGAARAVNVVAVESLCQSLESVFAALKQNSVAPSAGLFDLLHRAVATLSRVIESLGSSALQPPAPASMSELRRQLQAALSAGAAGRDGGDGAPEEAPAAAEPPVPALADSVRVRKRTLDSVLLRAEELLYVKVATTQRGSALRSLHPRPAGWRSRWARLRADVRAVDAALSGPGGVDQPVHDAWARVRAYIDDSHDFAASMETELLHLSRAADQDQRVVAAMVDQLLDEMKQIVVQPFSTLLDLFPPSVRELARDQGKEIDLVIQGGEIEIDRRILDEMKDPLIHLVRNSVDHGIEPPAVRRAKGKPARGQLAITVSQRDGNQVGIMLRDDGAGFDAEALQRAARKAGSVPADADAAPSRDAMLALAFEPGVSTSPLITDLSGRGLGLAIVKERVERLAGSLALESLPGQGATFHITLPLTLARFRGVVVRVGRHNFVLPTRSIDRVARIPPEQVKTVENREAVSLGGRAVAMVELAAVLGLPDAVDRANGLRVVVLAGGPLGQSIAFGVDEVLDEREVLVKPLGAQLERVRNIAGATVLGTGQVVPILHVPDLLRSAVEEAGRPRPSGAAQPAAVRDARRVLVVEDSITSRTLVKGILESAGYRVETAADGVEAFTALRSGSFDIVVSDVDMPRLNGFGLTAKIRADKRLADLPVVLVTALESREDREHGIDVGASAYIVKSRFDQGNLLEVIERLA